MRRYFSVLVILALLGSTAVTPAAVAAATSQPAPSAPVPARASAPEPEEEGEEEFEVVEEIEFEACEATEEDLEFAEMEEAEEEELEEELAECEEAAKSKGKAVVAPAACLVRRAESTITTLPGSDRVLLTVRYKNESSAPVAIGLRLKDHKGSLALERTTKHLGHNGVLHLSLKLGEAEMERALKAHEFDISLRAPNTPGYCSNLLEQHLSAHSAKAHGSRIYSSPAHS